MGGMGRIGSGGCTVWGRVVRRRQVAAAAGWRQRVCGRTSQQNGREKQKAAKGQGEVVAMRNVHELEQQNGRQAMSSACRRGKRA